MNIDGILLHSSMDGEPQDKALTLRLGSCSTPLPWACSLQELEPAWPDSGTGVYIKFLSGRLTQPGFGLLMFKAKRLRCERGLTSPTVMLM